MSVAIATVILPLYLVLALDLAATKRFRYAWYGDVRWLGLDDLWLLAPAVVVAAVAGGLLPAAGFALALAATLTLWLDAALFHVFTIELEPRRWRLMLTQTLGGGLRSELEHAARLLARRAFGALPLVSGLALAALFFARGALRRELLAVALLAHLVAACGWAASGPRLGVAARLRAQPVFVFLWLALAALLVWDQRAAPSAAALGYASAATFAGLLALELAARILVARTAAPALLARASHLRRLVEDRSPVDREDFEARAEHRELWCLAPHRPPRSAVFGRLAGANVILVTLESVSREHLACYRPGRAETPWLAGLLGRSVRSEHHFCVAPNTFLAHRAIYSGTYPDAPLADPLATLAGAGYATVYLSAASVEHFHLGRLLARCGAPRVIDRDQLEPHPLDGGVPSDMVLTDQAVDRLRPLLATAERFFLHVHAANTHMGYRVIDGERFHRFDPAGDYGRFLNSLEETDWILSRFFARLDAEGWLDDTLVVVSSDHGQTFGEHGYWGHSNAVVQEEVNVPFLLCHPRLAPRRLAYSSHFDVLPTVFDLLGVDFPEPSFGSSVFCDQRESRLLLYTSTRCHGMPSSFGLLDGDKKIVFDLLFDRYYETDWNDRSMTHLAADERGYFSVLFYRLLAARGLIHRETGAGDPLERVD